DVADDQARAARADRLTTANGGAYHRGRRMLRGGEAEMIIRLLVLLLHVRGPGQFEANPQQSLIAIEYPAEYGLGPSIVPRPIADHPAQEAAPCFALPGGGTPRRGPIRALGRRRCGLPAP